MLGDVRLSLRPGVRRESLSPGSIGSVKETALSRSHNLLASACAVLGLCAGQVMVLAEGTNATIQFNRDVRPILSDTCFPCHGFDAGKRKADLRLDIPEGATAVHKGHQAVKAKNLEGSELWKSVTETDPKTMMPQPSSGKKLKPEQVALLREWILQGAVYQKHWAFEAPVRPTPPVIKKTDWPKTDIDRFILAALEAKQLEPTREA